MTNKPLINRSGSTKSRNNFLIFRLTVAGALVGIFALFGFLDKNTLAQTWSEPVNSPPLGQVTGPVWAQGSIAQPGSLYINGKARFDTNGTADAFCTSAKVCAVDNGATYGLTGESSTGYGLYATSASGVAVYGASTSGYGGYFNGGNVVLAAGKIGVDNISPSALLTLGTAATTAGTLSLAGATSGVVTIDTLPAAGTWTLTLPANGGTANQFLQTDGAGNATWQTVAAGSQTPWTANENAAGYSLSGNTTNNGNLTLDSTSSATKGYTIINPTGGNVGIGNSTPAATLSLGTAGTRAGSLYLAGATTNGVTVNVPASVTTAYALTLPPAAPTVNGQALTATTAGVASWTTISAGSQTPWTADEYAASHVLYGDSTASANLTLNSTSHATKGYVLLNSTGGNVGINTATPGSSLDVKGTVRHSGATSGYMAVAVPAAVTSYTLTFPAAVGASGQVLQTTNATGTLGWVTPSAGGSQTPWTAIENAAGYTLQGSTTANGNMTIDSTSSGTKGYVLLNPTGGNVGIGTATPGYKLHVAGTLYASGQVYSNGVTVCQSNGTNCPSGGSMGGSGNSNYIPKFTGSTTLSNSLIYDNGSAVGINTVSPTDGVLDVVTYAGNNAIYGASSANGTGVYGVGGTYGVYGTGSQYGVWGTGSAGGVAGISNDSNSYGVYASNTAGGYGFYTPNNSYVGGNLTVAGTSTSNYIQTVNVNASSSISSSTQVQAANNGAAFYASYSSPTNAQYVGNWGSTDWWGIGPDSTGGTDRIIRVGSSGLAGAWNNGSFTWQVQGGSTSYNYGSASDRRLKENIAPLSDNSGLAVIDQLNPVSFNWKNKSIAPGLQYGFIAQDVQEVLPSLVSDTAPGGMLSLNYDGLIAPMVKSIQEQQKEIDDLKQQIAELKAR